MTLGEAASAEAMAAETHLHWVWCDMDADCGAHDHLLHLGGLLSPSFARSLRTPPAGALPHVGCGSHTGLVGGLAARVHEVTGSGELWGPEAVAVGEDAGGGA